MRTSITIRKVALALLVLVTISNANPIPQRRKHYQTSSSYLDSYQFPGQQQRGRQQRPPPPQQPPNQFGGGYDSNRFGQNLGGGGQRYPTNNRASLNFDQTFGSGYSEDDSEVFGGGRDNYGTRFDFEGSGSAISDDEDDFDDDFGSGDNGDFNPDPYNPTTTPKVVVTTPDIFLTTATTSNPYIDDFEKEGSGSGDCVDDEDGCSPFGKVVSESTSENNGIPEITFPTRPPTVTTDDIYIVTDPITTTIKSTTTTSTTTSTTTTTTPPRRTPPTTPPTTSTQPPTTTSEIITTNPPNVVPSTKPTDTTSEPPGFGPDKDRVPTPLMENRAIVIIIFITLVSVLVLGILISLCMLCRYHKRPPSEASSDTASSDLPMLKADAKRYQPPGSSSGLIRRAGSESPPPLPDLNLFDEPVKFDRKSSGGSIRKSKRDLKKGRESSANDSTYSNGNWKNPNWL